MRVPTRVLLLSDLHLPAGPSALRDGFRRFLEGPARSAKAVYLLGDIFEYWVGDDIGMPVYREECQALRALTRAGVRSYLIHGNRDYLLGPDFSSFTGVELLPDPYYLRLGGTDVLLSHGDIWCTQDRAYQRFRRISRSAWGRAFFLRWPRAWRIAFARRLREKAEARPPAEDEGILDVVEDAVRGALTGSGVARIIHGHTHRPARHAYTELAPPRERWVLADWREDRMEYLEVDGEQWERRHVDAGIHPVRTQAA